MRITERNTVLDAPLGGPEAVRPEAGRPAPPPAAPDGAGDRVSVSDTARELAGVRGQVGDLGAVREEKVAGLRAALESGQYHVEVDAVALSVLREVVSDALA